MMSPRADRLDPALLKLAGVVMAGAVAVQLDATIVNVAIDTLGRDLDAQIGASFGTAVLAVILQHQAVSHAASGVSGTATAFEHTFWWAVGFMALALIPALLLPRNRPEPVSQHDTAPAHPSSDHRPPAAEGAPA
jgi:hypothetical protein